MSEATHSGVQPMRTLVVLPSNELITKNLNGTDGHGSWECDDGLWAWWGRERDGYHRLHSKLYKCPYTVGQETNNGTIVEITGVAPGPDGQYGWECLVETQSHGGQA